MNLLKSGKYFNPKHSHKILATRNGYVDYKSTKTIGLTSFFLGAGRLRKEDGIDFHAGLYLDKIQNEYVKKGDVIATLYSSKPIKKEAIEHFINNLNYNNKPIKENKQIIRVMK
jgi:thymidine phosphorylase